MLKLLYAVMSSNIKEVKTLIKEGEDVNYVNTLGNSLLHIAIQNNENKILGELLNAPGIDINVKNKSFGYTPLILAVSQSNTKITKMLLDKNANVDIQANHGITALMTSLGLKGENDLSMLLLDHNANINIADSIGYTALCFAIENENELIFDKLLEKNADLKTIHSNGRCPAKSICIVKNESMAKKLCLKANENNQLNTVIEHLIAIKFDNRSLRGEFYYDFIKIVNSIKLKDKLDSLDDKNPTKSRKI